VGPGEGTRGKGAEETAEGVEVSRWRVNGSHPKGVINQEDSEESGTASV